jgi:hypothetical protein
MLEIWASSNQSHLLTGILTDNLGGWRVTVYPLVFGDLGSVASLATELAYWIKGRHLCVTACSRHSVNRCGGHVSIVFLDKLACGRKAPACCPPHWHWPYNLRVFDIESHTLVLELYKLYQAKGSR